MPLPINPIILPPKLLRRKVIVLLARNDQSLTDAADQKLAVLLRFFEDWVAADELHSRVVGVEALVYDACVESV